MGKVYRIFYSWQSSVDRHDNQIYIRNIIESFINKQKDYKLTPDEATRNTAGSPDIVSTIMGKIGIADVFICDLTITHKKEDDGKNVGMPNSNVLFELGVAVALLGWERIICVVNTHYGDIKLLPFDINHQRCLPYCKNGKEENKRLDLSEPILSILNNYNEIVARFKSNDYVLHDKSLYESLTENWTEEDLINSLNDCKSSRLYNNYHFKIWEHFIDFQRYPKNRFIYGELNDSYKRFTDALDEMITEFITLFDPVEYGRMYEDTDQEYTQDELYRILCSQRYKMREPDYFKYSSAGKEREYYNVIDRNIAKINYHCNNVIKCFTSFRDAISRLLFI